MALGYFVLTGSDSFRGDRDQLFELSTEIDESIDTSIKPVLSLISEIGNSEDCNNNILDQIESLLLNIRGETYKHPLVEKLQLVEYTSTIVAGASGATISIPAGTMEISAIPYFSASYEIDGVSYAGRHQFVREFRSVGNNICVNKAYSISIPANTKLHLTYTSIDPIGEPLISDSDRSTDDDRVTELIDLIDDTIAEL